jgi:hypothetical protein
MERSCAICGRPVEFVAPRWQHSGGSLSLDEHHPAKPEAYGAKSSTFDGEFLTDPTGEPIPEDPTGLEVPEEFSGRRAFRLYLQGELKHSPQLQAKLYKLILAEQRRDASA